MYDRSNTDWLYRYYRGDPRDEIAASLFRSSIVPHNRIKAMGLPTRPRGHFSPRVKAEWTSRPDIVALRDSFAPKDLPERDSPPLVPDMQEAA